MPLNKETKSWELTETNINHGQSRNGIVLLNTVTILCKYLELKIAAVPIQLQLRINERINYEWIKEKLISFHLG